ncbi:hypothetical protein Q31b_40380 [Novipirellula aureliae]|uniref:Uncharacterized protein n=1 Tax=Novipirellula aureliae TaxID=2527966 RepID=A0A5C6DQ60_9BACT|nr:hypothetical protein Q31b_40380 [Novipirellula aureliae]
MSFDALRRLQQTLMQRATKRDCENIRSVGFSPGLSVVGNAYGIRAQFNVTRKLKRVLESRRINPIESVRLLDRKTGRYRVLELSTQVRQVREVVPTGVTITTEVERATASLVVRWTTVRPVPAMPDAHQPDDPRWRWGLLTVSHLFVGRGGTDRRDRAKIRRVAVCGNGPQTIRSRVVIRGRIPGGPDVALVETGWDRLWLSGFVREIGSPPLEIATAKDLRRWVSAGTSGEFVGDGVSFPWSWQTYYPSLSIPGLGRLEHIVAYKIASNQDASKKPFGPGSSGGAITTEGLVTGLQVAAAPPRFDLGYAQTMDISFAWIGKQLRASALEVVAVVGNAGRTSIA